MDRTGVALLDPALAAYPEAHIDLGDRAVTPASSPSASREDRVILSGSTGNAPRAWPRRSRSQVRPENTDKDDPAASPMDRHRGKAPPAYRPIAPLMPLKE
jgi:hypothetical protein